MEQEIQFAKPKDVSQIVAFGYKSFDENALKDKGVSPSFEKTVLAVTDWVVNHAVFVRRNKNTPKFIDGVCAVQTTEMWWSTDPVLGIALYYIPPNKRSYNLAIALLKAAKEYAIMNKLPLFIDFRS